MNDAAVPIECMVDKGTGHYSVCETRHIFPWSDNLTLEENTKFPHHAQVPTNMKFSRRKIQFRAMANFAHLSFRTNMPACQ